jgi:hypothetical protein
VIAGADWTAGAAPPGGAPAARPGKVVGRGGLELIEMDDEDGLVEVAAAQDRWGGRTRPAGPGRDVSRAVQLCLSGISLRHAVRRAGGAGGAGGAEELHEETDVAVRRLLVIDKVTSLEHLPLAGTGARPCSKWLHSPSRGTQAASKWVRLICVGRCDRSRPHRTRTSSSRRAAPGRARRAAAPPTCASRCERRLKHPVLPKKGPVERS